MKLVLLAAAAMIAVPALAQTTPATPPADQTMPAGDPAAPTDASNPNQAAPAPIGSPTQQAPMAPPMTSTTGDPVGGYQPSMPAMSGGTAGAAPVFRPAMSPDQAYPAPAPLAHYPMCKPGQFDKCMQGAGSTHSRQVHRRRSR